MQNGSFNIDRFALIGVTSIQIWLFFDDVDGDDDDEVEGDGVAAANGDDDDDAKTNKRTKISFSGTTSVCRTSLVQPTVHQRLLANA